MYNLSRHFMCEFLAAHLTHFSLFRPLDEKIWLSLFIWERVEFVSWQLCNWHLLEECLFFLTTLGLFNPRMSLALSLCTVKAFPSMWDGNVIFVYDSDVSAVSRWWPCVM